LWFGVREFHLSDDDDVAEHVGFEQTRDACVSSVKIGAINVTTCVTHVTICVINVTICVRNVTICQRMPEVACKCYSSCACTCEATARIAAKRARRAKNARAFSMQVGIRVQMSQFFTQLTAFGASDVGGAGLGGGLGWRRVWVSGLGFRVWVSGLGFRVWVSLDAMTSPLST